MKLADFDLVRALRFQRSELLRLRTGTTNDLKVYRENIGTVELSFTAAEFTPKFEDDYKYAIVTGLDKLVDNGLKVVDAELARLGVTP